MGREPTSRNRSARSSSGRCSARCSLDSKGNRMAELDLELLSGQTVRVLEEAAFAFLEPTARPPAYAGDAVVARLSWGGPAGGELTLAADPTLACELAANLLGEDDPAAAAGRADEAIGELLNMLAGGF